MYEVFAPLLESVLNAVLEDWMNIHFSEDEDMGNIISNLL